MKKRNQLETELGQEVQCAKCGDYWPADPEFFYFSAGKPHSWCKACYMNDPKQIAKKQRFLEKQAARRLEPA